MAIGIKGRNIDLYVRFLDAASNPSNTDDTPKVAIYDSNSILRRASSTAGVSLFESPGIYKLSYNIPEVFADGYAQHIWTAKIGGSDVVSEFYFQVISSGTAEEITQPDYQPGDDIGFTFTPEEVTGMNVLLKLIRLRLKNNGTRKVPDGAGGYVDVACSVFTNDELIGFLVNSLSEFNSTPHITSFTFADPSIYGVFADPIIQGAVLYSLAAQALIEKGREFTVTDNGISFSPAAVSEILNNQFTAQYTIYREKLKTIKCTLKPAPIGLGTFRVSGIAPAFVRLRHLRARQII
jgi:hypothetical protein